ncbi:MAG: basic secretory protein-like protein, partial [Verrucomicrobiales bacterium]|nr:basic secretory protein-like protein [Verrucomicrobiales bacterium]
MNHIKKLTTTLALALALTTPAGADQKPAVTTGHATTGFACKSIPLPAIDDAAADAKIEIISGQQDPNGAPPTALTDGRIPGSSDDPRANFFFRAGSDGGRFLVDLTRPVDIDTITTYSWHRGSRAPQVYTLYATNSLESKPQRPADPTKSGWTKLADIDTRTGDPGSKTQHAAHVSGTVGTYRYLLVDTRLTRDGDPFGHTFFSEIDVTEKGAPQPKRLKPSPRIIEKFTSGNSEFAFVIDSTKAPDLTGWCRTELAPVLFTWYPKIIAMLPSDGFTAHDEVVLQFKTDMPRGVPAYASGNGIALGVDFFRNQLDNEAKGCVVHELVHVVQNYALARNNPDATRTPGWVTEGTADYLRWFLFEPEKNGARITKRNLLSARYDASYRTTGNFFD